jgi:hypothetical protein
VAYVAVVELLMVHVIAKETLWMSVEYAAVQVSLMANVIVLGTF